VNTDKKHQGYKVLSYTLFGNRLLNSVVLLFVLGGCLPQRSIAAHQFLGHAIEAIAPLPTIANSRSTESVAITTMAAATSPSSLLWSNQFSDKTWETHWGVAQQGNWGVENRQVIADPSGRFSQILRVRYPAGSASPTVARDEGVPLGGTQFYAYLGIPPQQVLRLSYFVRFSENFDFVKGGKLPGLFGGAGNNGGNMPTGTDGFSTRFMWRQGGDGEVYAYLPTSEDQGTSIGRGSWRFHPGVWHHLEQEVRLNQPGQVNGQIRVWLDGRLVFDRQDLIFRSVQTLKIEGILFSTFFGGGDVSWATPQEVFADFADFSVSVVDDAD
jgi:hypothetical protein